MSVVSRSRRNIKPRKIDYTNELYGWDYESDDQARSRITLSPREILLHMRSSCDPWYLSSTFRDLEYKKGQDDTGILVFHWVGRTVKSSKLARLLSWLLWWFDDNNSTTHPERLPELRRGNRCRARSRDSKDNRILVTSTKRLAAEVNLNRLTLRRLLMRLETLDLIRSSRRKNKLHIHLHARNIALAYAADLRGRRAQSSEALRVIDKEFGEHSACKTLIQMSQDELQQLRINYISMLQKQNRHTTYIRELSSYIFDWYGTKTQKLSMNRKRNKCVFVSDTLLALCDGQVDEAWVLSQCLFWFGLDKEGVPRPRIIREGVLWVYKSHRAWERELGIPAVTVRRILQRLENRGFIRLDSWVINKRKNKNQATTHFRPNVNGLDQSIKALDHDRIMQLSNVRYGDPP